MDQPRIEQGLCEVVLTRLHQPHENRRVALEVRNGEQVLGVCLEKRLLVREPIGHQRHDRTIGYRVISEALDVGLAERALPSEPLARHRPGPVPVTDSCRHPGQSRHEPVEIVEIGHRASVDLRFQPGPRTGRVRAAYRPLKPSLVSMCRGRPSLVPGRSRLRLPPCEPRLRSIHFARRMTMTMTLMMATHIHMSSPFRFWGTSHQNLSEMTLHLSRIRRSPYVSGGTHAAHH